MADEWDFTAAEREFLASQQVGRLATTTSDGSPTVVPVGFVAGPGATVVFNGFNLTTSAKWRNLQRDSRFAFVIDDGIGQTAKGVLLRGTALLDPAGSITLTSTTIISWGVDSTPFKKLTRRRDG